MRNRNPATVYEAIAALDQEQFVREGAIYEGVTVAIDLDHLSAGAVRYRPEMVFEQAWEITYDMESDFYELMAQNLLADGDRTALATQLRQHSKEWVPVFKAYYRSKGSSDMPISLAGCPGVTCNTLVLLFEKLYGEQAKQLLDDIRSRLDSMGEQFPRIVVFGRAATFFPAEYAIRQAFFPIPLSPVLPDYTVLYPEMDSEQLWAKGCALIEQAAPKKTLPYAILLQVLVERDQKLAAELITLAAAGTEWLELEKTEYITEIFASIKDPLVLMANNQLYRMKVPGSVFARGMTEAFMELKLGLMDEKPVLHMRTATGETYLALAPEVYGGKIDE